MTVSKVARFPSPSRPAEERPSIWSDEARLLEAIQSGNREAAESLVDRTYSAVFASVYRLCNDHDLASDLTQETFQKAWAALPGFDGRSQLFTWLYRIAYTTFLNHVRRPHRMTSLDEEGVAEIESAEPRVDEILANQESAEQLRFAVLNLPDDLRFTVTAHFWGGLPVREIARLEEITTVAIRKRLHRAFSILEALLKDQS